jgi:hypothetical protein
MQTSPSRCQERVTPGECEEQVKESGPVTMYDPTKVELRKTL